MIAITERRRPRVFIATVCCFVFLVLSRNTNHHASAKRQQQGLLRVDRSAAAAAATTTTVSSSFRGGSLEEPSSEEEAGDNESSKDASEGSTEDGNPVDDDSSSSSSSSSTPTRTEIATALRLEGKKHHDEGDFVGAAEVFRKAADTLLTGGERGEDSSPPPPRLSEDYATCRLHQALCNLKSGDYEPCIEACTEILRDGDDDERSGGAENRRPGGSARLPAIVNARAYHRRAKAKMALGDNAGALQDARTASFLGDGKAVNLYGKLMRETSSYSDDGSSALNPFRSPQGSSAAPISPHSALLESLLNKSGSGGGGGGFPGFSPASLLMGSSNNKNNNMLGALGAGGGSMVQSVLKNLVERLDDERTHATICGFLQKTDRAQIASLASMAGIDDAALESCSPQLDRLVRFCHGVTPGGIRRTVRGGKLVVYCARVIRRTIGVVNKYKSLIVAAFVLQWMKSAALRPLPINKGAARKAAKLAAKEALKDAMKATRSGFF